MGVLSARFSRGGGVVNLITLQFSVVKGPIYVKIGMDIVTHEEFYRKTT